MCTRKVMLNVAIYFPNDDVKLTTVIVTKRYIFAIEMRLGAIMHKFNLNR